MPAAVYRSEEYRTSHTPAGDPGSVRVIAPVPTLEMSRRSQQEIAAGGLEGMLQSAQGIGEWCIRHLKAIVVVADTREFVMARVLQCEP